MKKKIKRACGFDYGDLSFPERLFETESMNGFLDREIMDKMLKRYVERI